MTDEEKKTLLGSTPELTEDFKEWLISLFDDHHISYYWRPAGEILVECCHCGCREYFKPGKTTKDPLIRAWGDRPKPQKGEKYFCPNCGLETKLRPGKNRKWPINESMSGWYGQKTKDGGYVLRYFEPTLSSYPVGSVYEDESSYEVLTQGEKMRIYFPVGMKKKHYKLYYHTDCLFYHNSARYYVASEWSTSSCFNTMSYWYSGPAKGEIYPETYENMKGTRLEYSLSEDVMDKEPFGSITLADWQQAYIDNAYFETLYKLGLYVVIEHIMRRGPKSCGMNYRAKTVWRYLNISRQRLKDLTNHPQMDYLDVYRAELKLGEHWDDQIIEALSNGFSVEDIEYIRQFTTLKKFTNYFMKFKKSYNLHGLHVTYLDYLKMTERCGYDMTSSINIFPRDLVGAHDSRVDETHKTEAEKRKKEAEQRFKAIRNRFKKADAVYHYEEGTLLIRPAKNASEIVDEGRILHHCVGGDEYLESHAKHKTIICFLRRKKSPDKPYITVEINPDGEIKQWYGIHDSKPSEKRIDRWLDKYTKALDLKKLRREARVTPKAG